MNGGIVYFLLQAINARTKNVRIFAKDKDIWLSTETGSHFKLDDETGEIKAGFGGKIKHASEFKTRKVKNGKVQEFHYKPTTSHNISHSSIPKIKAWKSVGDIIANKVGEDTEQRKIAETNVNNIKRFAKEQYGNNEQKHRQEIASLELAMRVQKRNEELDKLNDKLIPKMLRANASLYKLELKMDDMPSEEKAAAKKLYDKKYKEYRKMRNEISQVITNITEYDKNAPGDYVLYGTANSPFHSFYHSDEPPTEHAYQNMREELGYVSEQEKRGKKFYVPGSDNRTHHYLERPLKVIAERKDKYGIQDKNLAVRDPKSIFRYGANPNKEIVWVPKHDATVSNGHIIAADPGLVSLGDNPALKSNLRFAVI